MRVYSVGHSSRELYEFINLLKKYGIELVADVRSYPVSSRFPHFSKETLSGALEKEGIGYLHIPELGGMRPEGYRKHMGSEEFRKGISQLIGLSREKKTAFMCAEKNWRECHRRFIAEELTKKGLEVVHIIDQKRTECHPKSIFL